MDLLQQLRTEASINLILVGRVTISLERSNEGAQPRREDDQITGTRTCAVGVRHACGYKYGCPRPDDFLPVCIAECQFAIQHVPGFVISVVDVKPCRPTTAPFMDAE